MKLQQSVVPSRLYKFWLLTFTPFPRTPQVGRNSLLGFLVAAWCDDHESDFLPLKLCLQDRILLSPWCRCQFTMCLVIQTHYYTLHSYKSCRNSLMTFLVTRDSHSVIHCCHSSRCSSHGVPAAAVLNKGTTQAQRCCGSSQCSHLSSMASLQSSTCRAWTVLSHCPHHLQNSAVVLRV